LEEYLDGALAPDEVERLNARLAADPQLAELVDELRGERETRAAVWRAMEPSESQAHALAERVLTTAHRSARRDKMWIRVGRYAQFGSAAAACLLLGFFFGWLGRDRGQMNVGGFTPSPTAVVSGPIISAPAPAPTPQLGVTINEIRVRRGPGKQPVPMLVVGNVSRNAASAGGLQEGDLLVSIDGQPVSNLRSLLGALRSGVGPRKLQILRDGQIRELNIQVQQ
jgi:anti-sigma factor RsiW